MLRGKCNELLSDIDNGQIDVDILIQYLSERVTKDNIFCFISLVYFCGRFDVWKVFIDDKIKLLYIDKFIEFYINNAPSFACKALLDVNRKIFLSSLHGLGVLNYENFDISGENAFLCAYLCNINNPIVIDVGANKGDYSIACRKVQPDARIYALEPHPVSFKKLKKIAREKRIFAFNLGISTEVGKKILYDRNDSASEGTSHASLYRDVIEKIHHVPSVMIECEFTTLDNFISSVGLETIDLLKIDTEGHEFSVLQSAVKVLRAGKVNAIQFEFNEMNVESRIFMKDFFKFLPEYDFYRLLPDGMAPLGNIETYRNPLQFEIFAMQNIVAIKR